MDESKKKILVFASGDETGGGSGFQELVENSLTGILKAKIVAVVSNHGNGGVRQRANNLGVPFIYLGGPWVSGRYKTIVQQLQPDLVCLSGWLKLVRGLDPQITINIHPGPLPDFGGHGMYGHHVHEAVIATSQKGLVTSSTVTMHFVTDKYDRGPVFFRYPVLIRPDEMPESLGARVNKIEHTWQSFITNLVLNGEISWDGVDPKSLTVPSWYNFL